MANTFAGLLCLGFAFLMVYGVEKYIRYDGYKKDKPFSLGKKIEKQLIHHT